jgi:hypothetical protein
MNVSPHFSGSKNNPNFLLIVGFLLGLLFDPEKRGDTFSRNVGLLLPYYILPVFYSSSEGL